MGDNHSDNHDNINDIDKINKIRLRLTSGMYNSQVNGFNTRVTDNYGRIIENEEFSRILDSCVTTRVETKNGMIYRRVFKIIDFQTSPDMKGNFYLDLKYSTISAFDKSGFTDKIKLYQQESNKEIKFDGYLQIFDSNCCTIRIILDKNNTRVSVSTYGAATNEFYLVIEAELMGTTNIKKSNGYLRQWLRQWMRFHLMIFAIAIVLKVLWGIM